MPRPHLLLTLSVLALLSAARALAEDRKPPPPPFGKIASLSANDKKHLLNDNFTIVKTVREMPTRVRQLLIPDAKTISYGMADAGREFQVTDVVFKEPPLRRLVLAAMNPRYCLVYFEQGGRGYSQHVALFRLQNGHASRVWGSGLSAHPLLTFPELRASLSSGRH